MRKTFFPLLNPRFIDSNKIIASLKKISRMLIRQDGRIAKIYLFGSFAAAKAGVHSDADILVVLKEDKRRMFDRIPEFILRFSPAPVPVDILVYTRHELQKMTEEGNPFIRRIMDEGMLIAAARD